MDADLAALLASIDADDALQTLLYEVDAYAHETEKPKRKTSAKRQKEEITRLRAQVEDLERLYKRLESAQAHQPVGPAAQRELTSMWEAIAHRQCALRARTEAENAKLHKQIEEVLHRGHDVPSVLSNEVYPRTCQSLDTMSAMWTHSNVSDTRVRLERLYAQRHEAFVDSCFSDGSLEFCAQTIGKGEMGSAIDRRHGWTAPFPARKLDQALWEVMCRHTTSQGTDVTTKHEVEGDTISVMHQSVVVQNYDVFGKFRSELVIRRFQETPDDLSVYVSCFFAEPLQAHANHFTAYEIMWYRVREVPNSSLSPFSQLQTSRHVYLDCSGSPPSSRKETQEVLTEFTLREIKRDSEWIRELLEHELVRASALSRARQA
ncbi:hypothetical protein Poli38472_004959 [Pythium oligandrum]|uniref:Uncharacterized protein n=1 Tax=Pythium oligandrum TaxID=41045 RepID=A0A8K1CB60_PYTOL|nr:hypothetical protein Poli38472_004959 [Pythium oligandrum]|eukprot:TMW59890.1 hypothetical protein Poli38472_004959 [Pythium oligandrum]